MKMGHHNVIENFAFIGPNALIIKIEKEGK